MRNSCRLLANMQDDMDRERESERVIIDPIVLLIVYFLCLIHSPVLNLSILLSTFVATYPVACVIARSTQAIHSIQLSMLSRACWE